MKVRVDRNKCIGCGACTALVPEVFKMEDGLSKEKVEEINDKKLEERIREVAEICPGGAIIISD
jgi:ferredoxin